MISLLRLIRFPNLLIIALTQLIAFLCLPASVKHQPNLHFLLLLSGTLMVAAAGYIINDYLDIRIDLINKPEKVVIGSRIARRWAVVFHLLLNFFAILCGLFLSPLIAFNFLVCATILWLYSEKLKKSFLLGNITIAFLTAWTIGILFFFDRSINWKFLLAYSIFAFLSTLIREIIKDVEDIKGDMAENSHTLPIVSGLRQTRYILIVLVIAVCLLLSFYALISYPVLAGLGRYLFFPYIFVFLLVPLLLTLYLLLKADVKTHFSRLSRLVKLIMVAGILSMIFLYRT